MNLVQPNPKAADHQKEPLIIATMAIMREIPKSFSNGLTTQNLGKPDYDLIKEQQRSAIGALSQLGVKTLLLPADEKNPDSQFPRDTVLSYNGVMFNLNPGSPSRNNEVQINTSDIKSAGFQVETVKYGDSAFIEGGDILAFDSQHLVIVGMSGQSQNVRTNKAGVDALASVLRSIDPDVTVIAVPHKGQNGQPYGVLHLETGMTPLTWQQALCDPQCHVEWEKAYYPLQNSEKLILPPWHVNTLTSDEGYAAHVLPINGGVIIAKGYPTVKQMADASYSTVIEVDMSEARKMDGSLRCWTILHNEKR